MVCTHLELVRCLSLAELLTKEQKRGRSAKLRPEETELSQSNNATHKELSGFLFVISERKKGKEVILSDIQFCLISSLKQEIKTALEEAGDIRSWPW